ncbi:MAG: sporulation protein YabP [Oscillospiraceae bacterium]|nr:sporulation protein YabP [Oscillospiraceae bacterium]
MQKNEQGEKRRHDLIIENRKILKATGVLDVEGFDGTKVFAMLDGIAFTVGGKGLKVTNFSAESGDLRIEGEIDYVTYTADLSRRAGILSRIFR